MVYLTGKTALYILGCSTDTQPSILVLQVCVIAPLVAPEPGALVLSKDFTVAFIDYAALCKIHMGKLEEHAIRCKFHSMSS